MAVNCWDYGTTNGTDTTWSHSWTTTTASTSTGGTYTDWTFPPRRYVVTGLKKWARSHKAALIRLINQETGTGWSIEIWMDGDVDVCNPDIEIIKARQWWQKVKMAASHKDKQLMQEFLDTLPTNVRKALEQKQEQDK